MTWAQEQNGDTGELHLSKAAADKAARERVTLTEYVRTEAGPSAKDVGCYPDVCTDVFELKSQLHELSVAVAVKTRNLEHRLNETENLVDTLTQKNRELESRLKTNEDIVTVLQNSGNVCNSCSTGGPVVAFSASLGTNGYTGPFTMETLLHFRNVTVNIGNAYTPAGTFLAPVRGLYFFRFTICAQLSNRRTAVWFYKNHDIVSRLIDYGTNSDLYGYASNAATVQLELGDVVYLALPADHWMYDDNNLTTFSGFLVAAL